MSYFHYDPDEYKVVTESRPCTSCDGDWKRCNGACNGFASMVTVRRGPEEIARLKAERLYKEENEILARANSIRARRSTTEGIAP